MFVVNIVHRQARTRLAQILSSCFFLFTPSKKRSMRNSLSIQDKKEQIKKGIEQIDAKKTLKGRECASPLLYVSVYNIYNG